MVNKAKKTKKKLVNINSSQKKKVRLLDIANQFNLAVSTVSRILNGSPENIKASKETRKKVLDGLNGFFWGGIFIYPIIKQEKSLINTI